MFEFIKRFFKKEIEKKEIKLSDLSKWLDERTLSSFDKLLVELEKEFEELKEVIENFKESLSLLRIAEIKNPDKIEDRVKNVVIGHKTSYVKVLSNFIDSVDIPKEVNYKTAMNLSKRIKDSLDDIARTTSKSYYAVQHLFHEELGNVAKGLKRINSISMRIIEKIDDSKVEDIDDVKAKILEIGNSIGKEKEFLIELREKGGCLLDLENQKQKFKDDVVSLEKSGDFVSLDNLKKEYSGKTTILNQKNNEVIQLFSSVESGLKKYQRIAFENDKLIKDYLNSPLDALLLDKDLKILDVFEKMKANLSKLELKDQKEKKVLEGIEKITTDKLRKIVSEYKEIFDERKIVKKHMGLNPVESKIKEYEYKLEHNKFKIEKLKEEIVHLEKSLKQINIDSLKKEIEEKLKQIVEVEVKVLV